MKIPLLRNHLLELSQVDHGFVITRTRSKPSFSGYDAWQFSCPNVSTHFFINLSAAVPKITPRPIMALKQRDWGKQRFERQAWRNLLTGRPIYAPRRPSQSEPKSAH